MHHSRRRSGHGSSSTTDLRKSDHPSVSSAARHKSSSSSSSHTNMTRRTTAQASSSSHLKSSKSSRDREREWERDPAEQQWWEEERESFPQYCMSCEKQFVPQDDRFLYCSEACRVHDQTHASAPTTSKSSSRSHSNNLYPHYAVEYSEPRDIVPRASPSRPGSMHYSPPAYHDSTLSAMRGLSIKDATTPPSPGGLHAYHGYSSTKMAVPSPGTSYSARGGSSKSAAAAAAAAAAAVYSATYDAAGYYAQMDRPLPRRATTYSRPKSIELVTPMVGR